MADDNATQLPCESCGTPVPAGASHCGACGTPVTAPSAVAKPSTKKIFGAPPTPAATVAPEAVNLGAGTGSHSSLTGSYNEDDLARAGAPVVGFDTPPAGADSLSVESALEAAFSDPVTVEAKAPEHDTFAPGARILDQYRIVRALGQGGMGTVYLARDDISGQEVAIKALPAEMAKDRDLRERFNLEARALAALDHPNIVPLLTYATRGDDRYLVMKFVAGSSVDDLLTKQKKLDFETAAKIFRAVVDALGYAHSQGVIHRDIKPANVLLSDEGKIFLVDFGIAKQEEGTSITQTGILMGTPQYMSPEQISGQAIDGRSDLYAAGLMLFEMLAGVAPFTGEKTFAILRAHVEAPPPDVRRFRPDAIPDALVVCIERLLEKNPDKRPQTATDVLRLLDGDAVPSTPPTAVQVVTEPMDREDTISPVTAAVEQPFFNTARVDALAPPRREPIAAIVMVAVLVAMVAGGFAIWKWAQSSSATIAASDVDAGPKTPPVSHVDAAQNHLVEKGRAALDAKDNGRALMMAQTVLEEDHDDIGALDLLLDIYIAQKKTDQAKKVLLNLQAVATDHPDFDARISERQKTIAALKAVAQKRASARKKAIKARPDGLTQAQITKVTRSPTSKSRLLTCWQSIVLSRNPKASATMRVEATVSPEGRVTSTKMRRSTIGNKRFLGCVDKVAKGWRFPKFRGPPIRVTYRGDFSGTR